MDIQENQSVNHCLATVSVLLNLLTQRSKQNSLSLYCARYFLQGD